MHNDLQAGLLNTLNGEALAVDPGYWQSILSELSLLSTGGLTSSDIAARRAASMPRLLTAHGSQVNGGKPANLAAAAPARSIAHLQLNGIMLASDYLWFRGVNHLTAALMAAERNPNVSGVLLEVNSGGGQATAGQMLMSTLEAMSTPVVVLTHFMGSAAVMAGLPAASIVASSTGVMVGSIGTYVQINTAQLQHDKRAYQTIYAKKSTNKNRMRREAQNGNFEPYQVLVDKINGMFLQSVRKHRQLTGDVATTLSGEIFFADDAKARGLIDHVGTLADAIKLLSGKIRSGGTVKASTARPRTTAKPQLATTPNADRPWLNHPESQKAYAREKGVKYDRNILLHIPDTETVPTKAVSKTATQMTTDVSNATKPNSDRPWLNAEANQRAYAKSKGVKYDRNILLQIPRD